MTETDGMILTTKGREILALALSGKKLEFTRAATGDGVINANTKPENFTALISQKQNLEIQSITASKTGICEVVVEMSNKNLATGYFVREYGLFAKHPDSGQEILYSYANKGDKCSYLEADNGVHVINYALSLLAVIDQAQNIVVNVEDSKAYVTRSTLDAIIADTYAEGVSPNGFWTYAPDDDKRLRPQSLDSVKKLILGTNDIDSVLARISRLEDNLAQVLLTQEMQELYPEYSHYIIENFENPDQIDNFSCKITSIIAGDDSIDCNPIQGLMPGSWYTISDGENSELVQVKSINIENGIQRIILSAPVQNTYILEYCKLYRTSANLNTASAAGATARSSFFWRPCFKWQGESESSMFTADLNSTPANAKNFTFKGNATINSNGFITLFKTPRSIYNDGSVITSSSVDGVAMSDPYAVDCSNAKIINSLVTLNIPASCSVHVLFFTSQNSFFKLNSNGEAENVNLSGVPDQADIQELGNPITLLETLHSLPGLAGKRFGVAFGLYSGDQFNALPEIKFALNCTVENQTLQTTKISPIYSFDDAQIISTEAITQKNGNANVIITAQFSDKDGNKSEWVALKNIEGRRVKSLQFKTDFSVADLNSSITLDTLNIIYSAKSSTISGENTCEIISNTENWFIPVRDCRMTIKHKHLEDSNIRAFVAMRKAPRLVKNDQLGIGTGARHIYQLNFFEGLRYDSLKLYYDNVLIESDYEINSLTGRLTCKAPEGVIISADYESEWDSEFWQEMTLSRKTQYEDFDNSEFKISLPKNNLTICAVKILLEVNNGNIQNDIIGVGSGFLQTYKLSHICRKKTGIFICRKELSARCDFK